MKEPTEAMLEAGVAALRNVVTTDKSPVDIVRTIYEAMVAAQGPFSWKSMCQDKIHYCTVGKQHTNLLVIKNGDSDSFSAWIGNSLLVGSTYSTIDAAKRAVELAYLGVPFNEVKVKVET